MSLGQMIRSLGLMSIIKPRSRESLAANPAWLCTVPLGLPVVPEV